MKSNNDILELVELLPYGSFPMQGFANSGVLEQSIHEIGDLELVPQSEAYAQILRA